MKNILFIESSPRGSDSYSHEAARSIVNELQTRNPGSGIVVRDLGQNPPPHAGMVFIAGMYAAPEQRTPDQAKSLALSDALIDVAISAIGPEKALAAASTQSKQLVASLA
jgi:FMN-dependent NADH-azoreductase